MNTLLLLEMDFGREVVVEKDHGPTCLTALLEWTETVRRQAESNITFVGKVAGRTIRDKGVEQRLVMGAIENVLDGTMLVHVLRSIAHLLRMVSISGHGLQPRCDREIVKIFARLSISLVSCSLAVGAFDEFLVRSNKANAAVYTTAVSYRLKSGK